MKRKKIFTGILLTLLALIFTIGLTFASVELPRLADKMLSEHANFPNLATGQDEATAYKTELYISHYNIRVIGYISLGLILVLIITGFILEKRKLASLGAVFLFLPVFGHFAATMFFLGGLAFLRFLWLPFLDISFDIMRLGDSILLPYKWILDLASLAGLNLWEELPFMVTGLGLFVFLLGVLAWMFGKIQKKPVTDFWIYRVSRHPQYLGWIIWSYGVLFLPGANMKRYVDVANTLPWLLATMIIIAVALLEERKMKQEHGKKYESFRNRTPFLFPLPRFIRKIFSLPVRIVFKKQYPERKREIFAVIGFYTVLLLLISAFSTGLIPLRGKEVTSEKQVSTLVKIIKSAQHRGEMRRAATELAAAGGSGVDSLIVLLDSENTLIRWYCADALGATGSEKIVEPLIRLLDDPNQNVRKMAAGSLGESGSGQAIKPLIEVLNDPAKGAESAAARSLGMLKAKEAVEPLIRLLPSENYAVSRWASWALGEIGDQRAVQPLIDCYHKNDNCDFYSAGIALNKLDSEHHIDCFITGMNKGSWWVQGSCAEALGESGSQRAMQPLINALKEGNERLRRAAVIALQNYSGENVITALKEAVHDPDFEVRIYAREALRSLEGQK